MHFKTVIWAILVFISLLLLRFWVATLFFNADFYNHNVWVNFMKDFGTEDLYKHDFTPWAQANYPPVANFLFLWLDQLCHALFKFSSQETLATFYKLVSLLPETGLVTYFALKKKWLEASLILFNPGIFYNTLFWGQTEGAISSFTALSILSFFSGFTLFGFISFATALLIKQSALVFIPILAIIVYKLVPAKKIVLATVITLIYIWLSFAPFVDNFWTGPIKFYLQESGGQIHQHLASVNAFNFWYLLGLNNISDSQNFLGFDLRLWGYLLLILILIPLFFHLFHKQYPIRFDTFTSLGILMLSTFLFTTRMHERHFFPVLILLIPFAVSSKKNFAVYSFLSFYHFLNLYWVWQYPPLPLSFFFESSRINFMIVLTILSFVYIYISYLKHDNSRY